MKRDQKEILEIAANAYPDPEVASAGANSGDGLYDFIVSELRSAHDSKASRDANLAEAIRVIEVAISDLSAVRDALRLAYLGGG